MNASIPLSPTSILPLGVRRWWASLIGMGRSFINVPKACAPARPSSTRPTTRTTAPPATSRTSPPRRCARTALAARRATLGRMAAWASWRPLARTTKSPANMAQIPVPTREPIPCSAMPRVRAWTGAPLIPCRRSWASRSTRMATSAITSAEAMPLSGAAFPMAA